MLQGLKARGIDVIFSSYLVPPELLAPQNLNASDPLSAVREALGAHDLELRQIAPDRFVVARIVAEAPRDAEEQMPEVSVYASRYAIEGRSIAEARSLGSPEIESIPGSHDDALRSLKALPGLATNASARPYIRGSLSEDVLVRYDGITLLDPYHLKNFQSLFSAIDPAAVDGIEVFSGGFPVNYGTRSGGVINISAPTAGAGYENRIAASLLSAGVSSIGSSDTMPMEWFGAIRRSTLDLLEPVEESFGTPQFSDSLGRLRWKTENGAWTAGWLLLDDRLAFGTIEDTEIADERYRDEYFWLARDHRFSGALQTRFAAVLSLSDRERSGTLTIPGVAHGNLDETQEFERVEVTNDWTYEASDHSSYAFGAELSASQSRYAHARDVSFDPDIAAAFNRQAVDSLRFSLEPEVVYFSFYAANRRKWADFEAEFGVRVDAQDYFDLGQHSQVSPRLNLRYDFNGKTRLYASAGRFTQAQHIEEWRVEEGQLRSDPAQSAVHSILGITHEASSNLIWSLEAYSKRWTRVSPYYDSLLNPLSLLPELAPDRIRVAPTLSEASGVELNVRMPFAERWKTWSSLSWSEVTDDFGSHEEPRSWDQSAALSAGVSWQGARLSLSALGGWHQGWPRTPFDSSASLSLGRRNSTRWADFYTLDLRGAWNWRLGGGELTTTLELTNSTDRQNPCCAALEGWEPGGTLEVENDHWLPMIVNLGLVYRWGREPR
jgi:outer membrane receptor protein involved in Fe transport